MAVVHLSPEMPRMSVRGHKHASVQSQLSEPSDPQDLLSTSLPSQDPLDDDHPGFLHRSFSISLSRPRSASAHVAGSNGKRKSLRLNRSRPSSARIGGKVRPGGDGKSPPEEDAATLQVDSAFLRIRQQLAQLADEDLVLRERVDKLNEEITKLITRTVVRRRRGSHTRTASQGEINLSPTAWNFPKHFSESHNRRPARPVPILLVSGSQDSMKLPYELLQEGGLLHEDMKKEQSWASGVTPGNSLQGDGGRPPNKNSAPTVPTVVEEPPSLVVSASPQLRHPS